MHTLAHRSHLRHQVQLHAQPVSSISTPTCSCSRRRAQGLGSSSSNSSSTRINSLEENGWGELTPDTSSGSGSSSSQRKPVAKGRPASGSGKTRSSSGPSKGAGSRKPDPQESIGHQLREQDSSWYSDPQGPPGSSSRNSSSRNSSSSSSSSSSSREEAQQSQTGSRKPHLDRDTSASAAAHTTAVADAAGAGASDQATAAAADAVESLISALTAQSIAGRTRLADGSSDSSSGGKQVSSSRPHGSSSSSTWGSGSNAGSSVVVNQRQALPGDWVCPECGDLNFASRRECWKCTAPRPPRSSSSTNSSSSSSNPSFTRPGDWTCPACSNVNFAWRTECRDCQEPRPKGLGPISSSRGSSSSSSEKGDKKKKKGSSLVEKGVACCYGCGSPLQTLVPAAAGYVDPAKFQAKQKHRQLKQVLCGRCNSLAHGAMIPGVKDFTQKAWLEQQADLLAKQQQQQEEGAEGGPVPAAAGVAEGVVTADAGSSSSSDSSRQPLELLGKVLVTAEELRDKIAEVSSVRALVVMLVDLLDVSGTLMGKVRDMVGNNPIVLVGTKMDLLPVGCSPKDVAAWLTEAAARRRLMVTSTHLISSRSGEGVAAVAAKIGRERKGRDVFVVGAANVGKSAFVRALLKEMSSLAGGNFDAAAAATSRYLPVESAMPGTTLGIIPLQAFETGGTLYDTPGVHLHHRVPHMLAPDELKLLHPRRRLAPFSPPSPLDIMMEGEQGEDGEQEDDGSQWKDRAPPGSQNSSSSSKKPKQVSASYLWSGLARVDVLSGPPSTSLVFYGPKALRVAALPLLAEGQEADLEWNDDDDGTDSDDEHTSSSSSGGGGGGGGSSRRVLLCKESVAARGGLVPTTLRVPVPSIPSSACLADVAISGLPGWVSVFAPFAKQGLELRVWVPRGVEVFLRPPVPCPPPRKALGREGGGEGEGVGEADLVDIGAALDGDEDDVDWEVTRSQLGLRPMSAEDEEVVKMLLYGNEAQGLTGIMDLEDEDLEAEEGAEEQEGEEEGDMTAAAAAPTSLQQAGSSSSTDDVAAVFAQALQAETMAATVADALSPKRRAKVSSKSSSRTTDTGLTIVEGEDADAEASAAGAAAARRKRRQR